MSIILETVDSVVADTEDGGSALILELAYKDEQTGENAWEGNSLVVRLFSWREEDTNHPPEVLNLIGKKVRVTIEVIE